MTDFKNIISLLMAGDEESAATEFVENVFNSLNESKWPAPTTDAPDVEELQDWTDQGGCEATDGCWVEPDGVCEHGHPSWLLKMGMI